MKASKLIYYLDDDTDDLEIFTDIAEHSGHQVYTFLNGNEMFYALKHDSRKPDLIFLDIHMPVLNGEEILNVIRKSEEYKQIPIVMISGAYPPKLVRHFLKSGANFLMKKSAGKEFGETLGSVFQMDFTTPKPAPKTSGLSRLLEAKKLYLKNTIYGTEQDPKTGIAPA